MINVFRLIKVELVSLLSTNSFSAMSKKKKMTLLSAMFIPAALMLYVSGVYSFALLSSLPMYYSHFVLLIMFMAAFMILIFFSFYSAYGHLFGFKDYDLLMSLPLTKTEIMLSKLFSFLLMNYFYAIFFIAPTVVMFAVKYPQPILYFVYAIIGFLFFPLIPMVITGVLSFIIARVSTGSKYSAILRNVFMFVCIGVIMVASFNIQNIIMASSTQIEGMVNGMKTILPTVYYYAMGIFNQDITYLLITVALNVAVFLIFVFVFSKLFTKLNGRLNVGYKVKNYQLKSEATNGQLMALTKKEITRYFSCSSYVMNSCMGPLMLLLAFIYLLYSKSTNSEVFVLFTLPQLQSFIFPGLCIMIYSLTQISSTTSCSISLEGKNFWIIKSSPINAKNFFLAKLILNQLTIVPISAIAVTGIAILLGLSLLEIVALWIVLIVTSIFVGQFGLIANLYFPKMEWDREIYVVKQSAASFISVLGGLAISFVIALIYFGLQSLMSFELFLALMMLIMIGIDIGMWVFLMNKGSKMLYKIN